MRAGLFLKDILKSTDRWDQRRGQRLRSDAVVGADRPGNNSQNDDKLSNNDTSGHLRAEDRGQKTENRAEKLGLNWVCFFGGAGAVYFHNPLW